MELKISTCMAAGDFEEALRLMAQAYGAPVGRFCAGFCGSKSDADDLLQETFVDAWNAMHRFDGSSGARAWLFGIARRVCIRHLRKRDRRSNLVQKWCARANEPVSREPSAEKTTQEAESHELLEKALQQLKPKLREAVLLYYVADLSNTEIAESLGIRSAAARKRVSLGIGRLRRLLRPILMEPPSEGDEATEEKENEQKNTVSKSSRPRLVVP